MERDWKPNVTVAAVIENGGRFLMVEEHTRDGLQLNQPAGHLEPGERLLDAVVREVAEETARLFTPEALLAVYQWEKPGTALGFVRFTFCGHVGEADAARGLDDGIVRTLWMGLDELRASTARHRSPLVMRSVDAWLSGRRFSLDLIAGAE